MLDFPSPATTGQLFSAGGMTWRFDGTKWTETTGVGSFADAPSDGNTYGRRNTAWNSVDAMLAPVAANANAALNDSGRSLIHNGLFDVQQRGQGPWSATATAGLLTADRWWALANTDTNTTTIAVLADADRTAIGDEAANFALQRVFTGNAAAAAFNDAEHSIEGIRRLSNKTVTLSFWAIRTAGTATRLGIYLYQYFGSGGSPSAQINVPAQTVTLATTWTRYTLTFSLPSVAGKTLGTNGDACTTVAIGFSSGSTNNALYGGIGVQSGTVRLWGVQLELGSVATPLAKRDPQQELALCQRFYCTLSNIEVWARSGTANDTLGAMIAFPVAMRAAPSVALVSPGYAGASGGAVSVSSVGGVTIKATATATGAAYFSTGITASADL